ncbi:MAG: hypothetical protein C0500_11700 [Sphingobium sp.]|nr:hypothetical protein [Sphingobium sp.]
MSGLTHDDFADKVGTTYQVVLAEGDAVPLTLCMFEPLKDSGRAGGSFRLEFIGPRAPRLPQAIYPFAEAGTEPVEIFIVPVAAQDDGLIYEAVFY